MFQNDQSTHARTHILRIDRKWPEKEKTSKHPSKLSVTCWRRCLTSWRSERCTGEAVGYLWPPAADPFYTLKSPTANALLTSLTAGLAASLPSTVPASATLLLVVVLFLMPPLNVLLPSALQCCQESGCLINSVAPPPSFFKKNLWT